jgi:hypothetical protein
MPAHHRSRVVGQQAIGIASSDDAVRCASGSLRRIARGQKMWLKLT